MFWHILFRHTLLPRFPYLVAGRGHHRAEGEAVRIPHAVAEGGRRHVSQHSRAQDAKPEHVGHANPPVLAVRRPTHYFIGFGGGMGRVGRILLGVSFTLRSLLIPRHLSTPKFSDHADLVSCFHVSDFGFSSTATERKSEEIASDYGWTRDSANQVFSELLNHCFDVVG
jgi:hypothetical protein